MSTKTFREAKSVANTNSWGGTCLLTPLPLTFQTGKVCFLWISQLYNILAHCLSWKEAIVGMGVLFFHFLVVRSYSDSCLGHPKLSILLVGLSFVV